jgi:hypothetical protein
MKTLLDSFWFAHGVVAILTQIIIATPFFFLGYTPWESLLFGGLFSLGCYVGRERHQAELGSNSRYIAPWDFSGNPKAFKDIGLPFILVSLIIVISFFINNLNL